MTLQSSRCAVSQGDMALPPSRHPSQLLARVWKNFDIILSDMDFRYEMSLLNISSWRLWRRKYLSEELKALTIALWRLALERSFPEDWQRILSAFMDVQRAKLGNEPARQTFTNRVETYLSIVERCRQTDFIELAGYLVDLAGTNAKQTGSIRLKLALHLRVVYNHLFEKLF